MRQHFGLPVGDSRRTVLVTAIVAGVLVLLGSVAYACVPWRGEMTVTPTDSTGTPTGGASVTVQGRGTTQAGSMQWCGTASYTAAEAALLDYVEVTVAPITSGSCAGSLGVDGPYDVTITEVGFADLNGDGAFSTSDSERVTDCMGSAGGMAVHYLGTLNVVSGAGSGIFGPLAFASSSSVPQEAAGICVTEAANGRLPLTFTPQGNMAPITVTLL